MDDIAGASLNNVTAMSVLPAPFTGAGAGCVDLLVCDCGLCDLGSGGDGHRPLIVYKITATKTP